MLRIADLTLARGARRLLEGASLAVHDGHKVGLVGANDFDALITFAKDRSPAVRMGVLLALRRLHRSEIAMFLHDSEPLVVEEVSLLLERLAGGEVDVERAMQMVEAGAEPLRALIGAMHSKLLLAELRRQREG